MSFISRTYRLTITANIQKKEKTQNRRRKNEHSQERIKETLHTTIDYAVKLRKEEEKKGKIYLFGYC